MLCLVNKSSKYLYWKYSNLVVCGVVLVVRHVTEDLRNCISSKDTREVTKHLLVGLSLALKY